jgi:signal peptidase I
MLNTPLIGDCAMVKKFTYGIKIPFTNNYIVEFDPPKRGDVVVFQFPPDPDQNYIKRIVGVPGDIISVRNKELYVNGVKPNEPYVIHSIPNEILPQDNFGPFKVPAGEYFMMGDNRDNSSDSREWGTVRRDAVIGPAWRLYWSWEGWSNIRWNRIGQLIE